MSQRFATYITGASRVLVLVPGASNIVVLFVAHELVVLQELSCFVRSEQATRSHTNMDDTDRVRITHRPFRHEEVLVFRMRHDQQLRPVEALLQGL